MTTKKSWWEDDDDEETTGQDVEVLDNKKSELVPLDEINRKAEKGALLGSVAALISVRALKACQMQETRIEALEQAEKPDTKPILPKTVKIGHFEMKTAELLALPPDRTLERILACAQETLEDPRFNTRIADLLSDEDVPQLVGAQTENDEED